MLRQAVFFALLLLFASVDAQRITVHGYITDRTTGERLLGASIQAGGKGTTSNSYGFYSIALPARDTLRFSFVGYSTQVLTTSGLKDGKLDIRLDPQASLAAVTVFSKRNEAVSRTQMSAVNLDPGFIKSLPAILGETDVLKSIQLLPGVQAGYEGNAGFYVRGGGQDENLILLDGMPVYNAMHLFGFFSIFNTDALQTVDVIKGGFPARYGGRLSSVLDIRLKEGNNNETHGEGAVGLLSARFTVEGPIKKGSSSFMISARRTYADLYMRPLIKALNDKGTEAGYYFYDLNAKANFTLGPKDHLYLSSYFGKDKFDGNVNDDFRSGATLSNGDQYQANIGWSNTMTAIRWNHEFSKKLFGNVGAGYTDYRFDLSSLQSVLQSSTGSLANYYQAYNSGIRDLALKLDLDYLPAPGHFVKGGLSLIAHEFTPGAFQTQVTNSGHPGDSVNHASDIASTEYDAYVEDDIRLSSRLKANLGIHLGAESVRGKVFASLQPRAGIRYLANDRFSIKASFASMNQYIHLLTNSGIGLPTDLWVPATDHVAPEASWQVAGGIEYAWLEGINLSSELYYKKMHNVIEYAEGSSFINSLTDWESKVVSGDGTSYGLEWMMQRQKGRTTGLIGYTLSWTFRQFPDLNNGNRFPFKYDRRHDLKLAVAHQLTPNIKLSADFVYGTGMATTLPVAAYLNNNNSQVYVYQDRNSYRLPAYHRLDLSAAFTKKKKYFERTWLVSIYNVYSRLNTYFIFNHSEYDPAINQYQTRFYKFALFPIIPSVSWEMKF